MSDRLTVARHWLDVGQPDRCLEVLAASGDVDDGVGIWAMRAEALLVLERWEESVRSARRGLAEAPDDLRLIHLLALAVEEVGPTGHEEAELLFLRGLAEVPDNVVLLTGYANLLTRHHELKKAGMVLDRAAAHAPEAIEVDLGRMQLAHARGRQREALTHAERILSKDPHHTGALAFAGSIDTARGRADRGSRHLRTAASQRLGDRELARQARRSTLGAHPLMWPVRMVQRLPIAVAMLSGLAVVGVATLAEPYVGTTATTALIGVWLLFVVYFWLAICVAHLIWRRRR